MMKLRLLVLVAFFSVADVGFGVDQPGDRRERDGVPATQAAPHRADMVQASALTGPSRSPTESGLAVAG